MNRRTLLLLLGAAAVGLLYAGDQIYRAGYEQPMDRLNNRLDGLVTREKKIKTTALEARRDQKRLDVYAALSLPYQPEQARAAYQQWLLALVDRHQMTQASVDPVQPRTIEVRNRTRRGSRGGRRSPRSARGVPRSGRRPCAPSCGRCARARPVRSRRCR